MAVASALIHEQRLVPKPWRCGQVRCAPATVVTTRAKRMVRGGDVGLVQADARCARVSASCIGHGFMTVEHDGAATSSASTTTARKNSPVPAAARPRSRRARRVRPHGSRSEAAMTGPEFLPERSVPGAGSVPALRARYTVPKRSTSRQRSVICAYGASTPPPRSGWSGGAVEGGVRRPRAAGCRSSSRNAAAPGIVSASSPEITAPGSRQAGPHDAQRGRQALEPLDVPVGAAAGSAARRRRRRASGRRRTGREQEICAFHASTGRSPRNARVQLRPGRTHLLGPGCPA